MRRRRACRECPCRFRLILPPDPLIRPPWFSPLHDGNTVYFFAGHSSARILVTSESSSCTASSTAASMGSLRPICPSSGPRVAGTQPTSRMRFSCAPIFTAMRSTFSGIQILQIRFDDEEGAGLAFTGIRVHKDGGLVAVHQCVCEIKTADAEVRHTDALRERAAGEFAGDCDSETIVTEKNVADSGDQDPLRFDGMRILVFFGEGFHFRGREEKTVARLAH